MQPSVSVIISVYNIEKHLEKCLDSVIDQTLKDIEIIVVNDGSTDNSLDIITQYARKDSRIVIVDKPNEGLAYARKSGIEAAHGNMYNISTGTISSNPMLANCFSNEQKKPMPI